MFLKANSIKVEQTTKQSKPAAKELLTWQGQHGNHSPYVQMKKIKYLVEYSKDEEGDDVIEFAEVRCLFYSSKESSCLAAHQIINSCIDLQIYNTVHEECRG